jgi:outer membrane protein OmpA-like peptidoglycan-associated protein
MKRKLFVCSLAVAAALPALAQQEGGRFYSEHFRDNLFISAGVGAQANLNPDNFDYGVSHAITPVITLSAGKWFTPVWGVRGQAAGLWSRLYTDYGLTGYERVDKHYATLHADGLFNLTNALCGYCPQRRLTLSVFAGPGLTFARAFGRQERTDALVNGSVGLLGQFNLNRYLDLNVEARGEVSPSIFGQQSNAYTDGALSLAAGVSYTFGGKRFVQPVQVDEAAINEQLNRYREVLAENDRRIAEIEAELSKKPKEVVTETVVETQTAGPRAIFFALGSSTLDNYGLLNIRLAADVMKQSPQKKYTIAGYADRATGNARVNQRLSDRRAQAVYDALIKEGVSPDQLSYAGHGGSVTYDPTKLNRVVILE